MYLKKFLSYKFKQRFPQTRKHCCKMSGLNSVYPSTMVLHSSVELVGLVECTIDFQEDKISSMKLSWEEYD